MTETKEAAKTPATPGQTAAGCGCLGVLAIIVLAIVFGSGKGEPGGKPDPAKVKPQAIAVWSTFLAQAGRCDAPATRAGTMVGSLQTGGVSIVDAYDAAKEAELVCRDAWSEINRLQPPADARGEVREAYKQALEKCGAAYLYKTSGMEQLAKVLNGDMSPAALSEFKRDGEMAQAGQLVCVASFLEAGQSAGLTAEDLKMGGGTGE